MYIDKGEGYMKTYEISEEEFDRFLNHIVGCSCGQSRLVVRRDEGLYIHCCNCKRGTKSYERLYDALNEWDAENS